MTVPAKHNIDFRKLNKIGHTGVRRAVLFMGLGLNATHRDDFNDYQLHKIPHLPGQTSVPMEFFPDDLPVERVNEFKKEFGMWIIACGMREIIEHYAMMLDQIYIHGLIVLKAKNKLSPEFDPEKRILKFQRAGLSDKFEELQKRFDIKIDGAADASQLYVARNALTHDLGMVTAARAPSGTLPVSWRGMDLTAVGVESGARQPVSELVGKITTEEMRIEMSFSDRRKEFPVGTMIRLTHQDLWEICFFFNAVLIASALGGFKDFLKTHGIEAASDGGKTV